MKNPPSVQSVALTAGLKFIIGKFGVKTGYINIANMTFLSDNVSELQERQKVSTMVFDAV